MSLLEVGNMRLMDDIYDYEQGTIDWDKINVELQALKGQYGQQIHDIVQLMLTREEFSRKNFIELESIINGQVQSYSTNHLIKDSRSIVINDTGLSSSQKLPLQSPQPSSMRNQ